MSVSQDTSPAHVGHMERVAEAVRLRIAGATYRGIAQTLGVSVSTAHDLVAEALRNYATELVETADQALHLELQRRDEEYRIAYTIAIDTKKDDGVRLRAIDRCIRISERRSKLLGLDAPERHEFSGPAGGSIPIEVRSELAGMSDEQLEKLDAELAAFAAGADAQRQIIEQGKGAVVPEEQSQQAEQAEQAEHEGGEQQAAQTEAEREGAGRDQRSIVERADKK